MSMNWISKIKKGKILKKLKNVLHFLLAKFGILTPRALHLTINRLVTDTKKRIASSVAG